MEWSYQSLARSTARVLTLASLVYAAWRYGAADTTALNHLSVSLGAALLLILSCRDTYRTKQKTLPVVLLVLMLAWVGYAVAQRTSIARLMPAFFPGIVEVREEIQQPSIELLESAIADLNQQRDPLPITSVATTIPLETEQALVPFFLAVAAAFLAATLFNTPGSRRAFLWTVVLNGGALAFWGIIQSANGSTSILPGVENTFSNGSPFASFIYKNAGAAALLPSLGAVAVLFYSQNRSGWGSQQGRYSARATLMEPKNLLLILIGVLLSVGLAVSLSRGAWAAAVAAIMAVALVGRFKFYKREHVIGAGAVLLTLMLAVGVASLKSDVRQRAGEVSLDYVSADQRWPQWADGFATAVAHLPSGSGLGTYGYATLPHQTGARRSWFREAHNQYLEVLTETGLIGILLLGTGLVWLAIISWRLTRSQKEREIRSWGLFAIALLVCGAVQSAFDFVLIIPANLMLYASLLGIIGVVARQSLSSESTDGRSLANRLNHVLSWLPFHARAAWAAALIASMVLAYQATSCQLASEKTLAQSNLPHDKPTREEVTRNIAALDAGIATQPDRAELYLRRAHWHLVRYRLALLDSTEGNGTSIQWQNIRLESVFAILSSQPTDRERESLLSGLRRTTRMRAALADAAADLSSALSLNPLSPRIHLAAGMLAPLTGMPTEPWLASTARLSNNSAEMLYLNGLFACLSGQDDLAVDQWTRSLSLKHTYLDPIMDVAINQIPHERIATELIPSERPDLFLRLLRTTQADSSGEDGGYDSRLADVMITRMRTDSSIDTGSKHATIAKLQRLLGDFGAEATHWEAALRARARDADFRWEYSQSLSRLGRNDEALKQAILGQTLNPDDLRFERLAERLRVEIRKAEKR